MYLSTPQSIRVELVEPAKEALNVREPANPLDPDSANPELVPAFVAYSASGEVRAPVVYVNYGLPPDYDKVEAAGVDVRGKIVMARYARSHRAVKIHTAQEHGAAAIIIYSDPADDGYAKGLTWPEGPWRADFQSQDGNGKYSWFWHGDPLSPGVGARADSNVLDPATAPTLPRIPADCSFLQRGRQDPRSIARPWRAGGFPGRAAVRVSPGARTRGGQLECADGRRAGGPSATSSRGLRGTKSGPLGGARHASRRLDVRRHGSGQRHVGRLRNGARSGGIGEAGLDSRALHRLRLLGRRRVRLGGIHRVRRSVRTRTAPEGGGLHQYRPVHARPLFRRRNAVLARFSGAGDQGCAGAQRTRQRLRRMARRRLAETAAERRRKGPKDFEVELAALGSGADFVAFQDYLGLPTLSVQYDFDGSYGTYHSNYDSRYYVEHFSDPGFHVARTLAQVFGVAVMRLADAPCFLTATRITRARSPNIWTTRGLDARMMMAIES